MKKTTVVRGLLCLAVLGMFVPVLAQDSKLDPHAHDWYNEQVSGKIDPVTGEKLPAGGTSSQSQNAANEGLKRSLESVGPNYRGEHKWFADDFMGIWFDGLGHGDPTSWSIVALLAMVGGGVYLKTRKQPQAPQVTTAEKASV